MKRYFIDSGAFIAQSRADDQYHKESLAISQKLREKCLIGVTTDYVLSETLTALRYRIGRHVAMRFYKTIRTALDLIIVYTNQKDFERAIKIFEKYHDKDFSFVDCVSFAIMQNYKITQAFTFDKHFEQVGFEIIK